MLRVNQLTGFGCSVPSEELFSPPASGEFFQGGYYLNSIVVGAFTYGILMAPKASGNSAFPGYTWKTTGTSTTGTSSLVDGLTNSNNMNNATHPAAQWARGLTINGYSDWYLPAKDELNLMIVNNTSIPAGEKNDLATYWSSSEVDAPNAWAQFFDASFFGDQSNYPKTATARVRAVRRFRIS